LINDKKLLERLAEKELRFHRSELYKMGMELKEIQTQEACIKAAIRSKKKSVFEYEEYLNQ
jgi:hypothetical protein